MGTRIENRPTINYARYITPKLFSSSTATYTAGRVIIQAVEVPYTVIADGINFYNGGTAAGEVVVGIYQPLEATPETAVDAVVIAESVSTVLVGTNTNQTVTFATPVTLQPGLYYIAIELSDATHTLFRPAATTLPQKTDFQVYYDRAGGYGALTNPCPAVSKTTGMAIICAIRVSGMA